MNNVSTAGIVLQVNPFREADSLLTVLSRELGRIGVIARSVRRSQKRFMGGLDLFDCGVFELSPPRGPTGPYILTQLKQRESFPALRGDLAKFAVGSFCLELTLQFAHEGEPDSAGLFVPLFKILRALDKEGDTGYALLLGVYYNLLVLQQGGFNFVDDAGRFSNDASLLEWFDAMVSGGAPIRPHDSELLWRGSRAVVAFTQEILGRELRSASMLPVNG